MVSKLDAQCRAAMGGRLGPYDVIRKFLDLYAQDDAELVVEYVLPKTVVMPWEQRHPFIPPPSLAG